MSEVPIRSQVFPPDDSIRLSHRVNFAVAWLGQLQYQLVCCYGFPQNFAAAKDYTNDLLELIHNRVASIGLPYLLLGDFNCDVLQLPSWRKWEAAGCKDLKQIYEGLFDQEMPPTCLGTTHPDNGIVCPTMQRFLTKVEVLPQDTFATHNPVIVTLQTDVAQPLRPRLPMPKTYLDFQIKEEELQGVVSMLPKHTLTLEQWGETMETLVDCAMQQRKEEGAVTQLPRAYRGRCKPREPVNMPYATCARSSRTGEYTPDQEITNFGAKKRSSKLRLTKKMIKSAGSVPGFAKFEFERHVAADRLLQKQLDKLDRLEDQKRGSKKHFSYIKHDVKPPLHALALPVERQCQATWDAQNRQVVLGLQPEEVHVGSPIYVEQTKGWVVSTADEAVTIQFEDHPPELPNEVSVTQEKVIADPNELAEQLTKYWMPLWNSAEQPTQEQLDRFDDLLQNLPVRIPQLTLQLDVWAWSDAIRKMKANTARGFDAFSAWELQQLPLEAIQLLVETTLSYKEGFPAWFMRARTCPIPKTDNTSSAAEIRPITILPVLYRVYASVIRDSHSVLIMLSIAHVWVALMKQREPNLEPTAYADNWGWVTMHTPAHSTAADTTLTVTSLCGLEVDWAKAWLFATSTKVAEKAFESLVMVIPSEHLHRVHHAKDLGFELRYSGTHRLGHRVDRYERAKKRLQRLTHLPADSSEKEKLWLVGILPQGFYGAEIFPPLKTLLKTFRSKVADSIFGVSQSMSPALALLLGTKQILDPEFQLIIRAVRAARRWLDNATYQHRCSFYHMAASFQGGLLKDQDVAFLGLATEFSIQVDERTHIHDFPDISRCETVAILNQLDTADRGHIIRAIAGGYQTQHQKCQWDQEASETCKFCTQPDSHAHRMYECPAFSDERAPFEDTIEWCRCNASYLAELPAVLCHHDEEAHRLMQFHEPLPVIPKAFMQEAIRRRDAAIPLCLFTDGSCTDPTCPTTRRAGYAVVMDLCETKQQRDLFATSFLETGTIPPCFQVLAVGRVQGEQTISRAELIALEVTTRFPGNVITATDSQYALNQVQYIKNQTFRYLQGCHVDIATRIATQLHPGHCFLKVKSHQVKSHQVATRDMPLDQVYQIMGNMVADETAKSAIETKRDDFNASLQARHDDVQAHRYHVRRLYDLMLQLQRARMRLESGQADTLAPSQQQAMADSASNRDIIMHFAPQRVLQQCVSDWGREHYGHFAWGSDMATSFEQWFCQLQWNDGGVVPSCCNTGVTWLELAVSFSIFRKQCLPIIRDSAGGQKKLLLTSGLDHCHIHSIILGDLAKTMQLMWSHFLFLVHPDHHPETGRGLCKSLVWLGFLQHSSGLLRRPAFFEQAAVVRYLEQVLDNKTSFDVPFRPTWIETSHSAHNVTVWDWVMRRDAAYKQRRWLWKMNGLL
eukprot:Skav209229  [mRNA]  locus=scaffold293:266331:271159:- [translate_table: standard]